MEQEEDSFEGQDNQNSSNAGTGIAASSTRSPAASKNSSSRLSSRDRDRKSPLLSSRRAVGISFDSVATGEPQPTNISSAVDIDFSSFSKVPAGLLYKFGHHNQLFSNGDCSRFLGWLHGYELCYDRSHAVEVRYKDETNPYSSQ
jgi:hypothetical protein